MASHLLTLSSASFMQRAAPGSRGGGAGAQIHASAALAPVSTEADFEKVREQLYADGDLYSTTTHAMLRCEPLGSEGAPPKYTLVYMPMRNRVETARLVLEEAGVPYDFEVVGWRPWVDGVKSTCPLGKLPVLRDYDGKGGVLAQETAITRFLAAELGLDGADAAERAEVDMLYQQLWCARHKQNSHDAHRPSAEAREGALARRCTLRNNGLTHDGEHYSPAALHAERNARLSMPRCAPPRRASTRDLGPISARSRRRRQVRRDAPTQQLLDGGALARGARRLRGAACCLLLWFPRRRQPHVSNPRVTLS